MTFESFENSLDSGAPFELITFTQGVNNWHYTTLDEDYLYLGKTFKASSITHGRISQSSELKKDGLKIDLPRTDTFAFEFISTIQDAVTTVTVIKGHFGDPDEEFEVQWKGRVVRTVTNDNKVTFECESLFTSMQRPGLRMHFELNCIHPLYGPRCRVNREAHKFTGNITSITNEVNIQVLGAGANGDGHYNAGMLIDSNGLARLIVKQIGDVVTLSRPLSTLIGGSSVDLYPGCDHLKTTCINKFNNVDNFGGYPYIPVENNPFGGNSII